MKNTLKALSVLVNERRNLTLKESSDVFDEIMDGRVCNEILAAFLSALKYKGECVDEVVGAATAMRARATFISSGESSPIDTCGTGGDGLNTFNISTTAAFITAGAGVSVAKHGNRGASAKSGSADVLARLGFNLDADTALMEHCLQENGIAFLFAPKMHPAMRYATPVRKMLGFRTIFNLLGPLVNPAGVLSQIIGVFDASYTELLAYSLKCLGSRRVMIVHSADGMDEISPCALTRISELKNGSICTHEFNPGQYLDRIGSFGELRGDDAAYNAEVTMRILDNKDHSAATDACLLNAAAGIYVAGKADDFQTALKMARESLSSGAAKEKLVKLIEFSKK